MKGWIVLVSLAALVCAGLNWLAPGAVLDGSGFALAAGVLSTVNAGRLRHPVWFGLLALMTVAGVVSVWNSLPISASYLYLVGPFRPRTLRLDTVRVYLIMLFATTVVLPLAALLSAFLLRPGKLQRRDTGRTARRGAGERRFTRQRANGD